jgi:hypothetical protein
VPSSDENHLAYLFAVSFVGRIALTYTTQKSRASDQQLLRWIKFLSGARASLLTKRRQTRHFDNSMKAERQRIALTKLFSQSEINARVEELARTAAPCLPGDFVVVGLLVGSFVLVADLVRTFYRIGCNPSVEFTRLNS